MNKLEVAKQCIKQGYCYIIDDCVNPITYLKCFVTDLKIVNENEFYLQQITGYEMGKWYNYFSNKKDILKEINKFD